MQPKKVEQVVQEQAEPSYTAPQYQAPPKTIERQGARAEQYSVMYPHVIGGLCEACGVIDNRLPSTEQYKLCPHFKSIGELRCSYCPETVNPTDIIAHADIKIHEHPDNPSKLVVVCDSYNCSRAHEARFRRSV